MAKKKTSAKSGSKAHSKKPTSTKTKSASKAKPIPKAKAKAASKVKAKTSSKPKPKTLAKPSAKKPAAKVAPAKKALAKKLGVNWSQFFSPLDDRLLVLREGPSERTAGGLFIPDSASAESRPNRGLVVAVGRGHMDKKGRMQPLDVQVNDRVLFDSHMGSEIDMLGETALILREREVLGVVK